MDEVEVDITAVVDRLANRIANLEKQAAVAATIAEARIGALQNENEQLRQRVAELEADAVGGAGE